MTDALRPVDGTVTGLLIPAINSFEMTTRQIGGFRDIHALLEGLVGFFDIEQAGVTVFLDANAHRDGAMNLRAPCLRWLWDPQSRRGDSRPLYGSLLMLGATNHWSEPADMPPELLREILYGGPYQVEFTLNSGGHRRNRAIHRSYTDAAFWGVTEAMQTPDVEDVRLVTVPRSDTFQGVQAS